MFPRSLLAILILVNYLWLAATGYISRPEQNPYMLKIQTSTSQQQERYEECRYLRMDGLEDFMAEALATRYQEASDGNELHTFSVVSGIDTHFFSEYLAFTIQVVFPEKTIRPILAVPAVIEMTPAVDSPPE
ncbi:hypothetical protein [Dyadobacter sp. LHD-138]|uniref:hypothetical protein n=1 Tax=Dyadobacter sp. LHD-138 TaxID=3071413 RepID=UPI0027E1F4AD|nr:hypothetical protein [Dyadobacter sp. LHD-138]MDQ6477099.1 hypothetical protein [Dyadobacter sp. LHD-138]